MLKKPFVIHPFLLAVFPVLFLLSHNIAEVSFYEALMPTAFVLGFTETQRTLYLMIRKEGPS